MGAGRPKEPFTLPDGWQDTVLSLYEEGGADSEVKAVIYKLRGSFSNDLWDRWLEEEPQFSETIKVGRMLSEAWWTTAGRKNLAFKDFNYTGWYMNMKNRFGWKDKHEVDQKLEHSGSIKHEIDHSKLSDAALREIASLDKPEESKD